VSEVKLTLIAALSQDYGIGIQGKLPWNLPEDLKRFRARTQGHPVVMGRKTLVSIGRALPQRPNFIISRDPARVPSFVGDIRIYTSLTEAVEEAKREAQRLNVSEVFVIGGGEIYSQALGLADFLDLTEVDTTLGASADAFFPQYDRAQFEEVSSEVFPVNEQRPLGFRFRLLKRRPSSERG